MNYATICKSNLMLENQPVILIATWSPLSKAAHLRKIPKPFFAKVLNQED
jgi:hypothetical protein